MGIGHVSIWWWAFGYFACYVPYSALTKIATTAVPERHAPATGLEMLPSSVMASVVAAVMLLASTGWWRRVGRRRVFRWSVPVPSRVTTISGLAASGIIATTTLAYTFDDVGIVFVMLLMRGGVLVLAPVIDATHRRRVKWESWTALGLSAAALVVATGSGSTALTLTCAIDIALYLGCYVVRLTAMSRAAKSDDPDANLRFFVEEQLVSAPALLLGLAVAAVAGVDELRTGFGAYWERGDAWIGPVIGVLSQGTGVFGALVLLDRRENTYCVPVNRASSVLAGVAASYATVAITGADRPGADELIGATLIIAAIAVLSIAPLLRRAR